MNFGVVVIGRNEGERLQRSLESVFGAYTIVYVDSGSTDGSAKWAREAGAIVVDLESDRTFTAARARNVGFKTLRATHAELSYVQFVDGDCELRHDWPHRAMLFLDSRPDVVAVSGRLRERYPERSIYNWLCDREWDGPVGQVKSCGGIAMMRTAAFEAAGGFRDDLIAGEEPELCVRLRANGGRIWRLSADMALHDASMTRFSQWWRRMLRSGYAIAQGAYLHGKRPERFKIWESRRAYLWGILLPAFCVVSGLAFWPWGWATLLIYPLQVMRQTVRNQGRLKRRLMLAFFQVLARFPEALGQLKFLRDRMLSRQARLIEYK